MNKLVFHFYDDPEPITKDSLSRQDLLHWGRKLNEATSRVVFGVVSQAIFNDKLYSKHKGFIQTLFSIENIFHISHYYNRFELCIGNMPYDDRIIVSTKDELFKTFSFLVEGAWLSRVHLMEKKCMKKEVKWGDKL